MKRVALVVLVVFIGCKKTWPADEVAALEKNCPKTIGVSRACHCYAGELSTRMPYELKLRFGETPEGSPERKQAANFAVEAISACVRGATITTWPEKLRNDYVAACVKRDMSESACACLVDVAETKITPEAWIAASLAGLDGRPLPEEIAKVFMSDESAQCTLLRDEWGAQGREALLAGCLPNQRVAGLCDCVVDGMMAVVTPLDMLRHTRGRGDGGVEARTQEVRAKCSEQLK
jgi:hypothetical protein